ncbi:MAG: response regulator, partial [Deltaproteobacteria bacterium]|nr:response regulator [Deltaproteobacteria bacterium]
MAKLLVIDDDDAFCAYLSLCTGTLGHECESAGTLHDGIKKADCGDFDLIFLDIFLPDAYGLDGIDDLQNVSSSPEIIIVTACGDIEGPEISLKKGAWYYLEKPPSTTTLQLQIKRALQYRE